MPVPAQPKIYHITHLDNLASIANGGALVSDARRLARQLTCALVGMSSIKQRRLYEIAVACHPGTTVGQYVPFYFCPRSVMLYILHKANNPELTYRGGQRPMVHLEADLTAVIHWANTNSVPFAFSDGNAGAYLSAFYRDPADLARLDWDAPQTFALPR